MSEKKNSARLKFFNEAVEYIDKFDNQELKNKVIISPFGSENNNSTFLRDETPSIDTKRITIRKTRDPIRNRLKRLAISDKSNALDI